MATKTVTIQFVSIGDVLIPLPDKNSISLQHKLLEKQKDEATPDQKAAFQQIVQSYKDRSNIIVELIEKASKAKLLISKSWTMHPYTAEERIEAREEASKYQDGQIQFNEAIYRLEIVRRAYSLDEEVSKLSAAVVDRLFFEASRVSEPTEDDIFFIVSSLLTSVQDMQSPIIESTG